MSDGASEAYREANPIIYCLSKESFVAYTKSLRKTVDDFLRKAMDAKYEDDSTNFIKCAKSLDVIVKVMENQRFQVM